jgi:hypothetical protein
MKAQEKACAYPANDHEDMLLSVGIANSIILRGERRASAGLLA